MTLGRRGYIDWLRGLGVLVMIEAHVVDGWTRLADRGQPLFADALIVGGMGAPIFLFLAGVALVLGIGRQRARGIPPRDAAWRAARRGLQIFALAFLFRLQSWVLSGGAPFTALLKVDILNIMGPSMAAAAMLWGVGGTSRRRLALLAGGTVLMAMVTPVVRATPLLGPLPDPVESYLRPISDRGTFALFPWAGFLLAGAVVGVLLDRIHTHHDERRLMWYFAAAGPAIALVAYGASFLPPIYAETSFWTSSPAFFFVRLGVLLSLFPLAFVWERRPGERLARRQVLQEFGRASLFVYWIHVEMVYGVVSGPIHKRFSLAEVAILYFVFTGFLFGLVRLKQAVTDRRESEVLVTH